MSYFQGCGLGTTDPQFFSSSSILANVNAPQPPPPSAGKAAESAWLKGLEKYGPMVLAAAQLLLALRARGAAPPVYQESPKSWAEKNLGLLILGGAGLLATVILLKK